MAKKVIRPIRIEGNAAYVTLTQGFEAIIDIADVETVDGPPWQALIERRKDGSIRAVYARRSNGRLDGRRKSQLMHRAILGSNGCMEIDHIDGNGLNNRRENLRFVTKNQNQQNQRTQIKSASGMKGVTWNKRCKRWQAVVIANGKRHYLGIFKDANKAVEIVGDARARLGLAG